MEQDGIAWQRVGKMAYEMHDLKKALKAYKKVRPFMEKKWPMPYPLYLFLFCKSLLLLVLCRETPFAGGCKGKV